MYQQIVDQLLTYWFEVLVLLKIQESILGPFQFSYEMKRSFGKS
jgi:hypothetical protein